MKTFRVLWEWSWVGILVLGFVVLATIPVLWGCDTSGRRQSILSLKCYSGGDLVVEKEVVTFAPKRGHAYLDTYWDFKERKYVKVRGLNCITETTGEIWTEEK